MSISQRRVEQERLDLKPGYKQWALIAPLGNAKVQRFIILKDHEYEGEYPPNPLQTKASERYACGVQGEVGNRDLSDLPEDILLKITSHLKFKDLNNLRLMSRRLNDLCLKQLDQGYQSAKSKVHARLKYLQKLYEDKSDLCRATSPFYEFEACKMMYIQLRLVHFSVNPHLGCGPVNFFPGEIIDLVDMMLENIHKFLQNKRTYRIILKAFIKICTLATNHFHYKLLQPYSTYNMRYERNLVTRHSRLCAFNTRSELDENVPPRIFFGSNVPSNPTMLDRLHEILLSDKGSMFSQMRLRCIELDHFGNSMCLENINRPYARLYFDIIAIDKVVKFLFQRDENVTVGPMDGVMEQQKLNKFLSNDRFKNMDLRQL